MAAFSELILLRRREASYQDHPGQTTRRSLREDEETKKTRMANMEQGGTTSTKRSQNGPMEPPDPNRTIQLELLVPTDINQKVNQLLHRPRSDH